MPHLQEDHHGEKAVHPQAAERSGTQRGLVFGGAGLRLRSLELVASMLPDQPEYLSGAKTQAYV
jgi:hypothetical protein